MKAGNPGLFAFMRPFWPICNHFYLFSSSWSAECRRRRLGSNIIAGDFYIVGEDKRDNFTSFTQAQIEQYTKQFWLPELFLPGGYHRSNLCLHPYVLMENYGD